MFAQEVKFPHLLKHETKHLVFKKFLAVFSVLALYFVFIWYKYGAGYAFPVTALTWSFFVLCTPVADAGLLLDFPIRLLLKLKMIVSELFVWFFAIILNVYFFFSNPAIYEKTILLKIFYKILSNPFPYWALIVLSAAGTFLSVFFADELLDVIKHKERSAYKKHKVIYEFVLLLAVFLAVFFLYKDLLYKLGLVSAFGAL